MKKYLSSAFISLGIMAGFVFALAPAETASAQVNVFKDGCSGTAGSTGSGGTICGTAKDGGGDQFLGMIKTVINVILFVVGIIAVIMIIVGGLRYTVSNGESAQIKAAKDTVLYAVIGLVIAIMAFAIVNFVVEQFS